MTVAHRLYQNPSPQFTEHSARYAAQTSSELTNYNLFCRALDTHDQMAWATLQKQYQQLVKLWVFQTARTISDYDADDLLQITYTKFWQKLSKSATTVSVDFPNLSCLLKYLKQCAITTTIDFLRKKQRLNRLDQKIQERQLEKTVFVEQKYAGECDKARSVRHWVATRVEDPLERLLLKLVFEYDLKPAEISETFPEQFPTVRDVRRVRERVLKRARRAFC